ncbi:MAG: polyribonucleotide nucleotidyltransferase [Gammaproteobacteria bacterium]|nr:polyribonucleotide nucleotidyltransferase [Gammaproteobacteria bacterium]
MNHQYQFELAGKNYQLEHGRFAKQADGSAFITVGDCQILATVCWSKDFTSTNSFFPMVVDYQEKYSAGGRFPGGFKKREGAPSEGEILKCRIIDRTLRPRFPKNFMQNLHIVVQVYSIDPNIETDVPALMAASAALKMTGLPINNTVAAVRVIKKDDNYIINPGIDQIKEATLDVFVSGNGSETVMVEAGAKEESEENILKALELAAKELDETTKHIDNFVKKINPGLVELPKNIENPVSVQIQNEIDKHLDDFIKVTSIVEKAKRYEAHAELRQKISNKLLETYPEESSEISNLLSKNYQNIVRSNVLDKEQRIDGRKLDEVRNLDIETSFLKRVHGSGLFIRGETTSLTSLTLGSSDKDSQIIDVPAGESKDKFLLHYNFPPFCTGESGFIGSPKRREIGHGNLAKKALIPMIPSPDEFPYSIRLVSDILVSNGSSSMATVCASSLAMMDAGVPIKKHVAGIAMGLVSNGEKFKVLTDILGDEDHLGDMDFKVAGTKDGVTALQMDIKITSIDLTILTEALNHAKKARLHILEAMNKALDKPKTEISKYAPKVTSFKVNPSKIKVIIGKGGSTIKEITEKFGINIDIDDSGLLKISSSDNDAAEAAQKYIKDLIADVEVGQKYKGTIIKILEFGAFVKLPVGKDGFLHISQISEEHVYNINDHVKLNDELDVYVAEIDRQNRIKLSLKEQTTNK